MTQHLLMFVMIALPLMGSMTRYTEGFNSLGDVFAGLAVGTTAAAYFILVPLRYRYNKQIVKTYRVF